MDLKDKWIWGLTIFGIIMAAIDGFNQTSIIFTAVIVIGSIFVTKSK